MTTFTAEFIEISVLIGSINFICYVTQCIFYFFTHLVFLVTIQRGMTLISLLCSLSLKSDWAWMPESQKYRLILNCVWPWNSTFSHCKPMSPPVKCSFCHQLFVFSAFSHSRWLFTLRTWKGHELFRCPITQIIYNLLWRVSRLESSKKKGGHPPPPATTWVHFQVIGRFSFNFHWCFFTFD